VKFASVMTDKRFPVKDQPAEWPPVPARGGFFESTLAAYPVEAQESLQEVAHGLLQANRLWFRRLRRTASSRAVLLALARDLDALEQIAEGLLGTEGGAVDRVAGRTARRLHRLARELRAEPASTEAEP
jgi:hypothetical protein